MASGMPTGASWNIDIGSSFISLSVPLTRMLVEVPMSVQTPPRMEQYESGISSREGAISFERAKPSVTGSRIATMAVLFIQALKKAASTENPRIAQRVLLGSRSRSTRPMWSTAPDASSAPPITNSEAMASGASFLKTSVIFDGSIKPSATTAQSTVSAITSGAAHSRMNAMSVMTMSARVSAMGQSMTRFPCGARMP